MRRPTREANDTPLGSYENDANHPVRPSTRSDYGERKYEQVRSWFVPKV